MLILLIFSSILAGVSKSLIDSTINGVQSGSILAGNKYSWWLGNTQNKWKNRNKAEGESYFLSSTLLVAFTDLFHFANLTLRLSYGFICVSIAMISNSNCLSAILYYCLSWVLNICTFHIFFHYIISPKTNPYTGSTIDNFTVYIDKILKQIFK